MKKIFYVMTVITILLVSFLGITYSYEYNDDESLKFELVGPYELYLDVNSEYIEYGIKVTRNGYDVSSLVSIDSSLVDMNKIGEYDVKYELENEGNKEYVYRKVKVIDNVSPEIILNGDMILYLELNEVYNEPGYIVMDNYDDDLNDRVVINNNVDTTKVGEYKIEYRVYDSSGNEVSIYRRVIVGRNNLE